MDQREDRGAGFNVASYLSDVARSRPAQMAIVLMDPRARRSAGCTSCSFQELDELSNRVANGLASMGIEQGMRVLVMVKPGLEFFAIVFALFKLGAVPVMIDPGMGVGRLTDCVRTVDLQGFIGVPAAHCMRLTYRRAFPDVKHVVTVGSRWGWRGLSYRELAECGSSAPALSRTVREDVSAILFTSGSTGPAKGVVYEHGMFDAQIRMIQAQYGMQPGEVDVPTFPLFALFSLAMGLTVVIPEMDASRPARADPAKIVSAIREQEATNSFGSPALWKNVAEYCVSSGIKLPTLRRVLIAGAPVAPQIIQHLHDVLVGDADVHTPYGATEALPVASISGREVLAARRTAAADAGTCVGRPARGTEVRMIRISDDPIEQWSDHLVVGDGEIGEIAVRGAAVTRAYYGLPQATRGAKIRDGNTLWHRMGDVGYLDAQGRLWYAGRKSQRVQTTGGTLFTDCCEGVVNGHPDVARSALVGVGPPGRQTSVIVIEPKRRTSRAKRRALAASLEQVSPSPLPLSRGERGKGWAESSGAPPLIPSSVKVEAHAARPLREQVRIERVLFRRSLPVDVRHNAKINREQLAEWASRKLKRQR